MDERELPGRWTAVEGKVHARRSEEAGGDPWEGLCEVDQGGEGVGRQGRGGGEDGEVVKGGEEEGGGGEETEGCVGG